MGRRAMRSERGAPIGGGIVMSGILADQMRQDGPAWRTGCCSLTYGGGLGTAAEPGADRDEALVDALRLREPAAAERLVARYGGRAYRLAVRITGNAEDAEEVVQDAML